MEYLDIAAASPSLLIDIDAVEELATRFKTSELKVINLVQEHGVMMNSVAKFIENGCWHSDQPQPLIAVVR